MIYTIAFKKHAVQAIVAQQHGGDFTQKQIGFALTEVFLGFF